MLVSGGQRPVPTVTEILVSVPIASVDLIELQVIAQSYEPVGRRHGSDGVTVGWSYFSGSGDHSTSTFIADIDGYRL